MKIPESDLKDFLAQVELLTEPQMKEIDRSALKTRKTFEQVLIDKGYLTDEQLGEVKATLMNVPFVNLAKLTIKLDVLNYIPARMAETQKAIAFQRLEGKLKVAFADPFNKELIELIEKKTNLKVIPVFATEADIERALNLYRRGLRIEFAKLYEELVLEARKTGLPPEGTRIVNLMLQHAVQSDASDIHIEPHEEDIEVRFRIDGVLIDVLELPRDLLDVVTGHIKILSALRTDEHLAPQDGRFKIRFGEKEIAFRVSIVPVYFGEKTVLRILAAQAQQLNLEHLGFTPHDYQIVHMNATKPHGMILVTGPTGSGKTTTMYAVLKMLNSRDTNVMTIEDPIEYHLPGINQIQVNQKTGLTFSHGLRAILRQDPNILMVGEIRDEETADIAINAALTGHLVLATLHTNSASSTLPRLMEMGVQNFLVASTVNMVLAQRLVRKICTRCIESYTVPKRDIEVLQQQIPRVKLFEFFEASGKVEEGGMQCRLYRGRGCRNCGDSGYEGRIVISEAIDVKENVRALILRNAPPFEIEELARSENQMKMMLEDGIEKALHGITTLEEVIRVTKE